VSVQEQFAEAATGAVPPAFGIAPRVPIDLAPANVNRPRRFYPAMKRVLDIAAAGTLLVLAAPVMAVVAIAIRMDSDGPIVFRQARLGLGGRPFSILKFRTMNVIEDGDAVIQATHNDKRVTGVGAFLRAASLDELPQLFNVLKGEMSLVGPRPHATAHDALYTTLIPNYELRQRAKPGITGWAQVNGYRGGTPTLDLMQRRVDLDAWYVANASLALDLNILLRTPLEILRPRNAY
jgi:putative colanic acid biosynthesis UDP-glucose lipid carrier transferase